MASLNVKYMRRLLPVAAVLFCCVLFLVAFPNLGKEHLQYVQTKTVSDLRYWSGQLLGEQSKTRHVVSVEDDQTFMMDMSERKNEGEATQRQRRRGVANGCIEYKRSLSQLTKKEKYNFFRHVIVNDKYKFLYCVIPKVACSNWKRTIMALDERVNDPASVHKVKHRNFTFLYDLPQERILYALKNYYKFMFVRPPLERLVSAYRDKFVKKTDTALFGRSFGRKIVRKYRKGAPKNPRGDDVTFPEFVRFVVDTKPQEMNEHWIPYVDLCHPCTIIYDFVGTMESFDEDVNQVLKDVGAANVSFPERQPYYSPTTKNVVFDYLKQLPLNLKAKLIKLYRKDFSLFGYKPM